MGSGKWQLSVLIVSSLAVTVIGEGNVQATSELRGSILAEVSSNVPDLLTPHNATHPVEALALLRSLVTHQMRSPDWQWLVSLITFILGAIMLWKPAESFKQIFVSIIFFVMYTMSMGVLHERYDFEHGDDTSLSNGVPLWEVLISVEIALCFALVAWRGFRGFELIIGMSLGVWPMRELQLFLVNQQIFGDSPWWNVIIITVSAIIGLYLNRHDNHRLELLVCYLMPLFGGRIVSASVGTLVGYFMVGPSNAVWLDYWHSLPLDPTTRAANINEALAGAPGIGWSTPQDAGPAWVGVVVGCLVWAGLSGLAIWQHRRAVMRKQQEMDERMRKESENCGPPTLMRKLTQPLINLG